MKYPCRCGSVIHTSGSIPNPSEYIFFADDEFAPYFDVEALEATQVYAAARSIFRCANCGRLWVYWNGFDSPPTCYRPERPDGAAEDP